MALAAVPQEAMEVFEPTSKKVTMDPNLSVLLKNLALTIPPNKTMTEGGGIGATMAFKTTGDSCLDFFANVVRNTSIESIIEQFVAAWNENPEVTLKLLLNLRDIRGGKGEKKLPIVLMYLLSVWKPQTYLAIYPTFLQLGCFKDFLLIAELAVRCAELPEFQRQPEMLKDNIELKAFASQLAEDLKALSSDENAGISLCAKWAPTEDGHFDRKPLRFARQLAKLHGGSRKDYRGMLSKLRRHLRVLEEMMCSNKWEQINFQTIPAKAHKLYRKAFMRDTNVKEQKSDTRSACKEHYEAYLAQLIKGEAKIQSTGIQPHELIKNYMNLHPDAQVAVDQTLESQWKDLVTKLTHSGHFEHVQAVVDVSGSMENDEGIPMQVAIALGLIVAELTSGPFKNKLITFHETPTMHTVQGDTLKDRVRDVMQMEWGGSTDIMAVFRLLLDEMQKDPEAQMVEKLFIFSDMQFSEASGQEAEMWATSYEAIQHMFANVAVPKIIFWNLRAASGQKSVPVEKNQAGTALVSGFSANMMKCFLEAKDIVFDPLEVMNYTLKKYDVEIEIPDAERVPFAVEGAWMAKVGEFAAMVEENLVPKKVERKRKNSEVVAARPNRSRYGNIGQKKRGMMGRRY